MSHKVIVGIDGDWESEGCGAGKSLIIIVHPLLLVVKTQRFQNSTSVCGATRT